MEVRVVLSTEKFAPGKQSSLNFANLFYSHLDSRMHKWKQNFCLWLGKSDRSTVSIRKCSVPGVRTCLESQPVTTLSLSEHTFVSFTPGYTFFYLSFSPIAHWIPCTDKGVSFNIRVIEFLSQSLSLKLLWKEKKIPSVGSNTEEFARLRNNSQWFHQSEFIQASRNYENNDQWPPCSLH